ncbi:MAG: MerR family transcriptional regulator [Firmicutes bacterium]|nr:MerR family transcriptional regulator [Bacillota bacterium]
MKRKYLIHEVAEQLNIAPSAIRFYEKKGLISPVKDPVSGYRIFDEYDIYKLWSITYHREFDLSVDEIYRLKHSDTLEAILDMVKKQKEETMNRIEKEKRQLGAWQYYERLAARASRHSEPPELVNTGDLHIFRRDAFYDKTKTLFSFSNLFYVFRNENELQDDADYSMLFDDDIRYILDADKGNEEFFIPSFRAYSVSVAVEGDFDEAKALAIALEKAKAEDVKVKPPYYVIYLLSSGDWEHSVRYYQVLLPAEI